MPRESFNHSNIEERLKRQTVIDPTTGCWIWQGSKTPKGYGHTRFCHKLVATARISAMLYLDLDISDSDTHVLHKLECPNKLCWNPEHLYLGTNTENARDRTLTGKSRNLKDKLKTHCAWGHEFNDKNTFITSQGKRHCRVCDRNRKAGLQ